MGMVLEGSGLISESQTSVGTEVLEARSGLSWDGKVFRE